MRMLLFSALMWARPEGPTLPPPQSPPGLIGSIPVIPPPPPVKEVKAVTPQRVRVGGQVQAAPLTPATFWFRRGNTFSEEERTQLEQTLLSRPEDTCTRGKIIANWNPGSERVDNLLWMIEHHPEWDGFLLSPQRSLMGPQSEQELGSRGRIRDAWLRQVGPDQLNGTVLHNAAMFFAISEPDFAASLLERAIQLEPDVPIHVERLGLVYAMAQFSELDLRRDDFADEFARQVFAQRTREILLASNDWLLVGGALIAMGEGAMGFTERISTRELGPQLVRRLNGLTAEWNVYASLLKLPSRSVRYAQTSCSTIPWR